VVETDGVGRTVPVTITEKEADSVGNEDCEGCEFRQFRISRIGVTYHPASWGILQVMLADIS
jgi:hypothetical protein